MDVDVSGVVSDDFGGGVKVERGADDDDLLLGEISTTRANRDVTLAKVPRRVADCWSEMPPDTKVGVLRFYTSDNAPVKASVLVETEADDVPVEHNCVFLPCEPSEDLRVFSESVDGHLAFEGRIREKCDLRPAQNEHYRAIVHARQAKAAVPLHSVSYLDERPRMGEFLTYKTTVTADGLRIPAFPEEDAGASPPRSPEREPGREKEKRDRLDMDELHSLIFRLFEKQQFWAHRDLVDATQQPQIWLKSALSELCDHHKRGIHKNFYELKPQFRSNPG